MMNRTELLYARAGATAIAAALALSSTTVLAQDAQQAQPTPSDSSATVAPAPTPTPDVADAPSDTSSAAAPTIDSVATPTVNEKVAAVRRPSAVKHAARAPAEATPSVARSQSKSVATRAAVAAPVPSTMTPKPATAPAKQSAVQPIVSLNSGASPATQAKLRKKKDDAPIIAAGGALAFLALGGAAVGLSRKRREDEEPLSDESAPDEAVAEPAMPAVAAEEQPAIIAPAASVFAWNPRTEDSSDRKPGETWVERAYRGPSPENPSLSLRKRLKRAAFFDKRDREVAAGEAMPVDADAGLPESMSDNQELELA